jgi:hypothetical protein
MSLICPIESLKDKHVVVICDSDIAKNAHKELFHFNEDVYITPNGSSDVFSAVADTIETFNSAAEEHPSKIHMAVNWENLLRISLWHSSKPANGEVFTLLKNSGLGPQELQPFKASDINDIFPYLYYGRQFNILRKLCHAAKKQAESRLKDHTIRVDCHIVAEDTARIVASSL